MDKNNLSRNEFLARAALGGMAVAMPATARKPAPTRRRPNFLVILSDDHMFRAVGYNNPVVKTPNLDQLAGAGIIFDRAYIATPICAASRASLLTGVFPQQHGSVALDGKGFHRSVIEEHRFPTMAQALAGAGYDTAFCGKSHLGPPRDYGFAAGEEHKDPTDDVSFAFASLFLLERQGNDTPFLLWVAARQPHIPLNPGQPWLDLYAGAEIQVDPNFRESPPEGSQFNQGLPGERYYRDSAVKNSYQDLPSGPPRTKEQMIEFIRAYYAVTSRLDNQIGELVATLKASGQYENTVIVYLSDNGYHLGNHGLGNKITMHEESVRVPMFIHWVGLGTTGVRCESLVSSLDLYPTLLDLAGVARPERLEGESLKPLFERPNWQVRDYVASECVGVDGKLGMGHRMARTGQWKYILTDTNEEVLFDETRDPYELTNGAAVEANRSVLRKMRRHLNEWMRQTGDTHAPPPSA